MLLDLPEVTALLDELKKEFEATDASTLYPAYLDRFNAVTEWKFSSGDYFHHEPFFEERGGFSSPVLVKRKYKSIDEARWLGKHCAGFIDGKHIVTVRPSQRRVSALFATLYDEIDSTTLQVRSVSFKWIGKPEKLHSAIGGLGRIVSRPDNTKLDVGVGIGGAFSVFLYQYSDNGRPVNTRAFSKGWPSEAEWQFRYDPDGQLDEISAGGPVAVWKRK